MKVKAVIIAGGSGKRLWPISTEDIPKPYLNLFGEENLIKNAYDRAKRVSKDIYMVVNIKHKKHIENLPSEKIYEIIGRNTAPAIALASLFLNDEDIMVVLPADHVIPDLDKFEKVIKKAVDFADKKDALITLGIKPTYPETGYGYIELGEKVEEDVYKVLLFHEKPDIQKAKNYIERGNFFWNSGIFIWKNKSIKSAFQKHLTEDYKKLYTLKEHIGKESFEEKIEEVYKEIKSVSIDKGILEKAKNIYVIPADFQWSDIGSWESLYNIFPKDDKENYIIGEVKTLDVKNSLILNYSNKETVVIEEDIIIVVITEDKILISKKGSSSKIKDII
ncbi:MAG: mannose-1-phosphate guanylyltransferase [Dictyoglomaceae bacterium]|nr:mannose-1-phosphate guanylyltransferase [Dictyoglomaceae bacterium]